MKTRFMITAAKAVRGIAGQSLVFKLAALTLLAALASAVSAQPVFPQSITNCAPVTCVYVNPGEVTGPSAPAIQIDSRGIKKGIGLLINTDVGTGIWSGASQEGGTGVWAVGINGAAALRVQGSMIKLRTPRNLLKVYDPDTGALVGSFEFEIVQE